MIKSLDLTGYDELDTIMFAGRINTISKLRKFPDLDTSLIRFIISFVSSSIIVNYYPKNKDVCRENNCMVWCQAHLDGELLDDDENDLLVMACKDRCKNCPYDNVTCDKKYIYPKQRYKLYNRSRFEKKLSGSFKFGKLHIKLLLVLQAWPSGLINKSGMYDAYISNVYVPDLASIINCNAEYLEDCLKELGNVSMLELDPVAPHTYNILLPNYYLKYNKASQGGGGYIQIDHSILESLLQDRHINSIRGKLFQLINGPQKRISVHELKAYMPTYVNNHKQYKIALDNDLYNMKYYKKYKSIVFKVRDKHKPIHDKKVDILKENLQYIIKTFSAVKPTFINDENCILDNDNIHRKAVNMILEQHNAEVPKFIKDCKPLYTFFTDALQISVEYGYLIVTESIIRLEKLYKQGIIKINNAGALLRTLCLKRLISGAA